MAPFKAWWRGLWAPRVADRLERRALEARRAAEEAEDTARRLRERTAVEALVGAEVLDLALYRQALRHRSAVRGQKDTHLFSNERLEFLGDAVLGFVVGEHLYRTFPDADEGYLSRLRAKLVSGAALAEHARALDLGPHLAMSAEMRAAGGEAHATLLADALEAVIGALYLDRGVEAARAFIHRALLDGRDLAALAAAHDNYKSVLLERAQASGWPQPAYQVVSMDGASHARTFTVEVLVRGEAYGVGQAASKKQAEQLAARAALERLASELSGDGR